MPFAVPLDGSVRRLENEVILWRQQYIPSITLLSSDERIDRELVLDFFVVFSRFEYALKIAGYVETGEYGEPQIIWTEFKAELEGKLESEKDKDLLAAQHYLLTSPPRRQKYNGRVRWERIRREQDQSDEDFLVEAIKTIRNNLFHGGKETMEPLTERDRTLIRSALLVLAFFISVHDDVKAAFDEIGPEPVVA